MPRHREYWHVKPSCSRCGRAATFLQPEPEWVTSLSSDGVIFTCARCGEVAARYYREPVVELEAASIDDLRIGSSVTTDRIIAWVGYAKNPHTVRLEYQQVTDRMALLLTRMTGIEQEKADGIFAGKRWRSSNIVPWRIAKGFRQQAKWELLREAYDSAPLRSRGLWFQDVPVTGAVREVVRCVTGSQVPGYYDSYYGDYDPAYLDGQVHHRILGCTTDIGLVLVHPSDLK